MAALAATSFSSSSSAAAAVDPTRPSYASVAAAPSSSGVVVLPSAPKRVQYFAAADAVQKEHCYLVVQNKANDLFAACGHQQYAQLPVTMTGHTREWNLTQTTADATELSNRVVILVDCDAQRLKAMASLKKVSDAFSAAIAYCTPPTLDPQTIVHLKKMQVPVHTIEDNYRSILQENVEDIQKKKSEIDALSRTIDDAYHTMKRALEPTAYRLKAGTFGLLNYGTSYGGTPYVDAERDACKAAQRAKPPVALSDNKEEI